MRETEQLEKLKDFAGGLAEAVVKQDFLRAQEHLAPWLQAAVSPADLRERIEQRLFEMNGYWEIDELIYPVDYRIDSNPCTLADLNELRSLPDEVTGENFRKWMVIQFLPDESDERIEFDAWFDFWIAVVELDGELRIGFFEFEDPD